jgi:hypothetical protein
MDKKVSLKIIDQSTTGNVDSYIVEVRSTIPVGQFSAMSIIREQLYNEFGLGNDTLMLLSHDPAALPHQPRIKIEFYNPSDAMLFKLAFGGE